MNTLQICPPYMSDVATFPSESPKKSFVNIIIHILQIIYVTSEETNSNCFTAASAVYLLLFSVSYYLHSPSKAALVVWGTLQERVY